jgi:hypothetical protein
VLFIVIFDQSLREQPEEELMPDLSDSDYYTTTSILVGTEEQKFTMHNALICALSRFFKAACSRHCGSSESRAIRLPEISIDDFQLYADWVYLSTIGVEDGDDDADKVYCRMYILGDVLDDYRLRNAAMERLIDGLKCTAQPNPDTVWDIYERTPTGSPLRKFLVDRTVGMGDHDKFAGDVELYPAGFVQELAVSLIRRTPAVTSEALVASVRSAFHPETGDL